ncbi:cytochrome P450 [Serendipita vermifera]|nr:cytochrome P450 [Serendipita vermifera]
MDSRGGLDPQSCPMSALYIINGRGFLLPNNSPYLSLPPPPLTVDMSETIATLLDSPIKACTVSLTLASLGCFTVNKLQNVVSRRSIQHSYPPGPPQEPLIGAMRSFPRERFFERFSEWAVEYGDIVYAPVPGMDVVVLNSYDVARELLAKRPNTTSGRRVGYLVLNLMELSWNLALIQPTAHHSNQRKMLRKAIGPQRIGSHDPLIECEVGKLVHELAAFKGNPNLILQRLVSRIVSKLTYGGKIWDEMGDELSLWNIEVMELFNEAFFAVWLVDIFHFLRFVPDWLSTPRFKQISKESSDLSRKIRHKAYLRGVELYKAGELDHSLLQDLLEEYGEHEDVQDAAAVLYTVSSDTVTGAIVCFLHALFLHPEIAKRVSEEVNSVTQGHRLPSIRDRPSLPYTEAVFKESVRRYPFMPLGVPHVNDQDEILRGYLIPKGTTIHVNTGAMFKDERVWGDPEVFRPERFLDAEASQRPNPLTMIFGYGMRYVHLDDITSSEVDTISLRESPLVVSRVCPGMYFADRVAFHLVVTICALFEILPLEGKARPDPKDVKYPDTLIRYSTISIRTQGNLFTDTV